MLPSFTAAATVKSTQTKTPAKILVTGAGGFIGAHLVTYLKNKGHWVRGVDLHRPEFSQTNADEFIIADLRLKENCDKAAKGVDWVIHLAALMGGIGFIESHKAEIVRDNALMNVHMLEAARLQQVQKFFFPSSACIYPIYKQQTAGNTLLKETDAYPADPEDGYGWEKLFMERLCRHYLEDFGLATYVARFHNVYGPLGVYAGGKEKSPAAICRKVALATDGAEIEVWGDGQQTRSYCYISDCVEGIYRLIQSDYHQPINLGSDFLVSINELIDLVANIAGKKIRKKYDLTQPQGVRGRNSSNELLRQVLQWEPQIPLAEGMAATYAWIEAELAQQSLKRSAKSTVQSTE